MKRIMLIILSLAALSACSLIESIDGQPPLTSPCVGVEGSPCGPKRPVNIWLYKQGTPPLAIS